MADHMNKTALILGATGGVGGSVTDELLSRGRHTDADTGAALYEFADQVGNLIRGDTAADGDDDLLAPQRGGGGRWLLPGSHGSVEAKSANGDGIIRRRWLITHAVATGRSMALAS